MPAPATWPRASLARLGGSSTSGALDQHVRVPLDVDPERSAEVDVREVRRPDAAQPVLLDPDPRHDGVAPRRRPCHSCSRPARCWSAARGRPRRPPSLAAGGHARGPPVRREWRAAAGAPTFPPVEQGVDLAPIVRDGQVVAQKQCSNQAPEVFRERPCARSAASSALTLPSRKRDPSSCRTLAPEAWHKFLVSPGGSRAPEHSRMKGPS
jgi:hypothetical protein